MTMRKRLTDALMEVDVKKMMDTDTVWWDLPPGKLADTILATSSMEGIGDEEDARIYWRQAKVAREHADVLGEALDKVNALIRVLSLMTSAEADDALATIKAARDAHQAFKEDKV